MREHLFLGFLNRHFDGKRFENLTFFLILSIENSLSLEEITMARGFNLRSDSDSFKSEILSVPLDKLGNCLLPKVL